MSLRALIWDVDGTLAETERDGHRAAFNDAFAAMGLPWRWSIEHYGVLLATSGGLERLQADMAQRDDAPRTACERLALARELHRRKNAAYLRRVADGTIALRPGVRRLMREAHDAGALLAIATTTGRANIDALLSRHLGAEWADGFAAVLCAEDAPLKKPHPQVYALALRLLSLQPHEAMAVEDSPNGLASARRAGIHTVLTRSEYFASCDAGAALVACHDLDGPASAHGVPAVARVHWPWLCGVHRRALRQRFQPAGGNGSEISIRFRSGSRT